MSPNDAIQLLLVGLSQGCIYSRIAIGLVLIYKATELVNFAQGDLMMIGAFAGLQFIVLWGFPYWAGFAAAIVVMAAIGYLSDAVVVRRLIGQPAFAVIIMTLAAGFVLRSAAGMTWGFEDFSMPSAVSGTLAIGGAVLSWDRVLIVIVTFLLGGALYAFFRFSRIGIAMQALSLNQLAAYYMGIPVKRLISGIWALAAVISTMAGIFFAPTALVSTQLGFLGFKAFAGAIIGGFGSIPGAFLGCLLIGIAEPFIDTFVPTLKGVGAYVIMFAVLIVRPEGLVSTTFAKKV